MKNPLTTTKRKVIAGGVAAFVVLGVVASATAEPELEGSVSSDLITTVETNPDTLPSPEATEPPATEPEVTEPPATEPPATEPETPTTQALADQLQVNDFFNATRIELTLEAALPATVVVSDAASNFEQNGPVETALSFNEASDIMADALDIINDDTQWRDPTGLNPVRELLVEGISINVVAYNNAATAALTYDVEMLEQSVSDQNRATELFVEANSIIEEM